MARYKYKLVKRYKKQANRWPIILALLAVLLIGGTVLVRVTYINNLRPVSSSTQQVYFTVESGWSIQQIADQLKSQSLIRSSTAFKNYAHTKELSGSLQAGTYILSPSNQSYQDLN